jgi:hypothetical protein
MNKDDIKEFWGLAFLIALHQMTERRYPADVTADHAAQIADAALKQMQKRFPEDQ